MKGPVTHTETGEIHDKSRFIIPLIPFPAASSTIWPLEAATRNKTQS